MQISCSYVTSELFRFGSMIFIRHITWMNFLTTWCNFNGIIIVIWHTKISSGSGGTVYNTPSNTQTSFCRLMLVRHNEYLYSRLSRTLCETFRTRIIRKHDLNRWWSTDVAFHLINYIIEATTEFSGLIHSFSPLKSRVSTSATTVRILLAFFSDLYPPENLISL